jgi:DNA-binding NtrC family response regulator
MRRRILVVDDEEAIRLTLQAILDMNGFEVETASSAREAADKLTKNTYHMVITDLKMESETAGYEVVQVAKAQPYQPATAILTAFPSLGSEWQNRGAQQLLVKPVGTDDLLRQIEVLLIQNEDRKQSAAKKNGNARAAAAKPARTNNSASPSHRDQPTKTAS